MDGDCVGASVCAGAGDELIVDDAVVVEDDVAVARGGVPETICITIAPGGLW